MMSLTFVNAGKIQKAAWPANKKEVVSILKQPLCQSVKFLSELLHYENHFIRPCFFNNDPLIGNLGYLPTIIAEIVQRGCSMDVYCHPGLR